MPDLKNIRQIGSPTNTNKIYIESRAYERIHREEFPERRVFVLMGHTECAPIGYTTFVEDVIPVWDITFSKGIPVWNSHTWNEVFNEVKRSFENSVIIGWALDTKGVKPHLSAEVEMVHREHFGGAHQLLFLLDTLEQEECFYQNRSGNFYPKEGFYIYFDSQAGAPAAESDRARKPEDAFADRRGSVKDKTAQHEEAFGNDVPEETADWGKGRKSKAYGRSVESQDIRERSRIRGNREKQSAQQPPDDLVIIECEENARRPRARYRELVYGTERETSSDSGKWFSSAAVFVAVLLLFAIIGTGIRQGRFSLDGIEQTVESISTKVLPQSGKAADSKENADTLATDAGGDDEKDSSAADAGGNDADTSAADPEDVSAVLRAMEQTGTDAGILVEEVPQGNLQINP